MKLGDIKAEALNLMSIIGYMGADNTNIDTFYNDDTARSYLYAMNGSLNRAMTRLYNEGKLGKKDVLFNNTALNESGEYDLSLLPDYGRADRVFIRDENGGERPINFIVESNKIKLRRFINPKLSYRLTYYKKAPYITYDTPNSAELDIADEIGHILPYFIKGELYADEEPGAASAAMSYFEQYLFAICEDNGRQEYVQPVLFV